MHAPDIRAEPHVVLLVPVAHLVGKRDRLPDVILRIGVRHGKKVVDRKRRQAVIEVRLRTKGAAAGQADAGRSRRIVRRVGEVVARQRVAAIPRHRCVVVEAPKADHIPLGEVVAVALRRA